MCTKKILLKYLQIWLDIDPKILLEHEINYKGNASTMSNAADLTIRIILSILYNYFYSIKVIFKSVAS